MPVVVSRGVVHEVDNVASLVINQRLRQSGLPTSKVSELPTVIVDRNTRYELPGGVRGLRGMAVVSFWVSMICKLPE